MSPCNRNCTWNGGENNGGVGVMVKDRKENEWVER